MWCMMFSSSINLYTSISNCFWLVQFNSIQFILSCPISQITNLPQRAFQSVHIRHAWPLTSHRIRKNSPKIEEKLSLGKKGKTPSGEQQRRMDRSKRWHVTRRNHYRVTTQLVFTQRTEDPFLAFSPRIKVSTNHIDWYGHAAVYNNREAP